IRSSGFSLNIETEEALPEALVDRQAMSQAVMNLVDNALKYSTDVKDLRIRVWHADGELAIEVADRGIGIPESEQQRVFERFYRVNTGLIHETKGSGLGLTLTKNIVEAHRGRIDVDSRPGRGSRFTIFLPVCATGGEPQTRRP